jgi:hypothetical protein
MCLLLIKALRSVRYSNSFAEICRARRDSRDRLHMNISDDLDRGVVEFEVCGHEMRKFESGREARKQHFVR